MRWILLIGFFLVACQVSPLTPAPTTIPTPTARVLPTSNLLPTLTATPAAPAPAALSATPTLEATPLITAAVTPDPNEGVGGVLYEGHFDESSWVVDSETASFSTSNGQLNAVIKQANTGYRVGFGPPQSFDNQQLQITLRTQLCGPADEFGFFFRMNPDERGRPNGYLFKLTCAGKARVEVYQRDEIRTLADWVSPAVVVSGAPAENNLLVWMVGSEFRFYLNGHYLFAVTDKTFADGGYGVFLRDRTNTGTSVSFTNLIVREAHTP